MLNSFVLDTEVVAPSLVRVHKHQGTDVIKGKVYHGNSWSHYPALIQIIILVKPYAWVLSLALWIPRIKPNQNVILKSIRYFYTVPPITCSGPRSAPGYGSLSVWDYTPSVCRHVPCISSRHVIARMVYHVSLQCPFYVENGCSITNKWQNACQCMSWPLANSLSGHLLTILLEGGVKACGVCLLRGLQWRVYIRYDIQNTDITQQLVSPSLFLRFILL